MVRFLFIACAVSLATLGAWTPAKAQTIGSWQSGNGSWSTNGWKGAGHNGVPEPNHVPNGIGHTALFNNASVGTTTQNVPGLIVGTISYNGQGGNNARTIGMDNNITLNQDNLPEVDPGPGFATIEFANPTATTTSGAIIFGSATVRGELILADDLLITNSTTHATGGPTTGAIQIFSAITGVGNVTISNSAAIGTPSNTQIPRGIWLRNGTADNTFVGNVLIQKGLVAFSSATSFGDPSNVITLGEAGQGSAMMIATEALAGVGIANKLIVAAGSGGTLTFGSASNNNAYTVHSGPIELNADANLRGGTTSGSGVQAYSGVISGVGGLTKVGGEVIVILEAANTYTGKTNVQVGTVRVASLNRVLDGAPSSNLGAPTTVAAGTIGLGGFNNAGAARPGILDYIGAGETTDRVIDLAGTTGGATILANGTGPLVFESDFTATGAGLKVLTLAGASADDNAILGAIVDSAAGRTEINKTDDGKWILSGQSTYTGKTNVQAGTLRVASLNRVAGGTPSSNLGAPTTAADGTVGLGGAATTGVLDYVGPGETTDRVINLAGTSGGATIQANGAGPLVFESNFTATGAGFKILTLSGENTDDNAVLGAIVDSATDRTEINKTGLGKWVLGGANTYTGETYIVDGQLEIAHSSALGSSGNAAVGWTAIGAPDAAALVLSGDISSADVIYFLPRSTNATPQIINRLGNNTLSGAMAISDNDVLGPNQFAIQSDAGKLSIAGDVLQDVVGTATLTLRGAGNGEVSGSIVQPATNLYYGGPVSDNVWNVSKEDAGLWTLSGVNTYTGTTTVNDGTLDVEGAFATLGSGDVFVAGGILEISAGVANALADTATVSIFGTGKLHLGDDVQDTIAGLFLGEIEQLLPGTYGSTSSAATYTFDDYFSGDGVLIIPGFSMPGDFNGDNEVDAADYVVWRKTMSENTEKYEEWRLHFGNPPGSGSGLGDTGAVPEPASLALLVLGGLVVSLGRIRN